MPEEEEPQQPEDQKEGLQPILQPQQPENEKEGLQPVLQPQQPQQLLNREQLEALRNKLQMKYQ